MNNPGPVLSQCAMCKESLEQSCDGDSLSPKAASFNTSILFLLALVFSLVGAIVWKVVRIMNE